MQKNLLFSKEVEALYRALPIPLLATLFNAIVIVLILKDHISKNALLVWVVLNVIIISFRFVCYLRFKNSIASDELIKAYRLYMIGIIASAMVWGSSVYYLLPNSSTHAMLLIIIIGGMVAGGVGSSSYRPESYIFYNLFAIGPYALHFMLDSTHEASWMMGAVLLLFSVMMILSSKKFHANFTETVLLQIDQQELIAKLENAAIAKDAFFATMSHELRTPLNAIIGFSQIVMKRPDTPKELLTFIEKIFISGKHLLELVNTILDFSKMQADKMEITLVNLKLSEIFKEVLIIIEPLAQKREITLHFPTFTDEEIIADRKMIQQIFINLFSNAIKFSPNSSSITLTYQCSDRHLFSVCDQGIGISPENLETIFDPFTQIEGSMHNAIKGTGLGLAIVKKMIEAHNGEIWVTSTIGEGSCFSFTIPSEL